jgi:N-acetyl-anhydromuramyl-L-alanine amidase AmpD
MQIKETNLKFNGTPKKRSSTKRIIVHHSASGDVSAATIHGWHLARKDNGVPWLGIGYHFVIRQDGTIERGRPENSIGAHAGASGNGDSIGVCFTGNFEEGRPTEAQLNSFVWLEKYLRPKYGALNVQGHRDVMATACPGKNFPWAYLRAKIDSTPITPAVDAITALQKAGVINSPDYWLGMSTTKQPAKAEYVEALLINMAKYLERQ